MATASTPQLAQSLEKFLKHQLDILKEEMDTMTDAMDELVHKMQVSVQKETDHWTITGQVNQLRFEEITKNIQRATTFVLLKSFGVSAYNEKESKLMQSHMSPEDTKTDTTPDKGKSVGPDAFENMTKRITELEKAVGLIKKTTEEVQEKQGNVDAKINVLEEENESAKVTMNELNKQITSITISSQDCLTSITLLSKRVEVTNQTHYDISKILQKFDDKNNAQFGMIYQVLARRLTPLEKLRNILFTLDMAKKTFGSKSKDYSLKYKVIQRVKGTGNTLGDPSRVMSKTSGFLYKFQAGNVDPFSASKMATLTSSVKTIPTSTETTGGLIFGHSNASAQPPTDSSSTTRGLRFDNPIPSAQPTTTSTGVVGWLSSSGPTTTGNGTTEWLSSSGPITAANTDTTDGLSAGQPIASAQPTTESTGTFGGLGFGSPVACAQATTSSAGIFGGLGFGQPIANAHSTNTSTGICGLLGFGHPTAVEQLATATNDTTECSSFDSQIQSAQPTTANTSPTEGLCFGDPVESAQPTTVITGPI